MYSGLLKFHYFNGQEDANENVHVSSTVSAGDLIPELLNRFLPSLESRLDALEGSHHTYIALVQGDSKLTNFTVARLLSSRHCPLTLVASHFDWGSLVLCNASYVSIFKLNPRNYTHNVIINPLIIKAYTNLKTWMIVYLHTWSLI